MDRAELEELLRQFEDAWTEQEGERLTSPQFYDRYRTGEIDSVFAMAWASYYEIYRSFTTRHDRAALVDPLVAA